MHGNSPTVPLLLACPLFPDEVVQFLNSSHDTHQILPELGDIPIKHWRRKKEMLSQVIFRVLQQDVMRDSLVKLVVEAS